MAPFLALHRMEIAADQQYFFLTRPESYQGDIGTATGIKIAADSEKDRPDISVEKLVTNGKLFRIVVTYKVGNKRRTGHLLCTKEKLGTVFDALLNKTFTGKNGANGVISSVGLSQKAKFDF